MRNVAPAVEGLVGVLSASIPWHDVQRPLLLRDADPRSTNRKRALQKMTRLCVGIDVGYGRAKFTSGVSFFAVTGHTRPYGLDISSPTQPLDTPSLRRLVDEDERLAPERVAVVVLDAPITPSRLSRRPSAGRRVDARFSRGGFSNGGGNRGPQPGSIATPNPGWSLYEAGMELASRLQLRGVPTIGMPDTDAASVAGPACFEVIPKLTQSLMVSRQLTAGRPKGVLIDDFLFPKIFSSAASASEVRSLDSALAGALVLSPSVRQEADRIGGLPSAQRHEAVGAFVAGFQAAMCLAGVATLVGATGEHEGYYLLPQHWHTDWEQVWIATDRKPIQVRRASVQVSPLARAMPG